MQIATRRLAELGGMAMIGDGILAALRPDGHVRLWEGLPKPWRALLEPFAGRPGLTRAVGIAEAGLGLLIAEMAIGEPRRRVPQVAADDARPT